MSDAPPPGVGSAACGTHVKTPAGVPAGTVDAAVRSDGSRKVCRHFTKPGGCRNGDSCHFAHISLQEQKRVAQRRRRQRKAAKKKSGVSSERSGAQAACVDRARDDGSVLPTGNDSRADERDEDVDMQEVTQQLATLAVRVPKAISFGRKRGVGWRG